MFLRPQRVLNLVVDKHLQLAEKWKAIHICNLEYQLDPAKVFWKIGSNKQEDFFGLYLGNLTTLRYSKDEDLLVFINREEERQKSKPGGDARPRKKKNISTLKTLPDKAAGIQPAGAGPGTNGGGGGSQVRGGGDPASPTPSQEAFLMAGLEELEMRDMGEEGELSGEASKPNSD